MMVTAMFVLTDVAPLALGGCGRRNCALEREGARGAGPTRVIRCNTAGELLFLGSVLSTINGYTLSPRILDFAAGHTSNECTA